jgi:hypothetical protein
VVAADLQAYLPLLKEVAGMLGRSHQLRVLECLRLGCSPRLPTVAQAVWRRSSMLVQPPNFNLPHSTSRHKAAR